MNPVLLLAALLPAIILLIRVYKLDKIEKEPRPLLVKLVIVGALTGDAGGLAKDAIGKIDVFATRSYVAIARTQGNHALAQLRAGKIKGRKFRVNML